MGCGSSKPGVVEDRRVNLKSTETETNGKKLKETKQSSEFEKIDQTSGNEKSDQSSEHEKIDQISEFVKIGQLSEHEKIDQTSEHEKIDQTSEHEKIGQSSEFEKIDQSSENEKIDQTSEHEKNDQTSAFVETDQSSEFEKIDQSSEFEKIGQSSENEKIDQSSEYEKIDQHARNAPSKMKNSPEDLVNYLSTVSKDPRILVRGFFIWMSENIRYDVDGFFGRAPRAACDGESVMKGGRSVCGGYANVMELLCKQAGIPVKKITGFAKGFGHSASNPFTIDTNTGHAWNAIQLEGKWYLFDGTWGAGHLDQSNSFKKEFREFYFMTDPKHFISSHFPYMGNNMEESQRWQLLQKPLTLEEFNKNVEYSPAAFTLGAKATSHPYGYIEMKHDLKMTFKCEGSDELAMCARLMLKEGNKLIEQQNATFGYLENGINIILVHPPKIGHYRMHIFAKAVSDERMNSFPQIMEYFIHCTEVKESKFEYPMAYLAADVEKTVLHEPLRGILPANKVIKFRVSAPYLQNVMVDKTYLGKSGTMFTGKITTCEAGQQIGMYGTRGDKYTRLQGLYAFKTVDR